jgi:hypothetical protein
MTGGVMMLERQNGNDHVVAANDSPLQSTQFGDSRASSGSPRSRCIASPIDAANQSTPITNAQDAIVPAGIAISKQTQVGSGVNVVNAT